MAFRSLIAALALALIPLIATAGETAPYAHCAETDHACQDFVSDHILPAPTPELAAAKRARFIGHILVLLTDAQTQREARCLAIAAYSEASGQGAEGMAAIVWAAANRAALARTPPSPCASLTDAGAWEPMRRPAFRHILRQVKRGDLPDWPKTANIVERRALDKAKALAWALVAGTMHTDPTHGGTDFVSSHTQKALGRPMPRWTTHYTLVASIGDHDFYHR